MPERDTGRHNLRSRRKEIAESGPSSEQIEDQGDKSGPEEEDTRSTDPTLKIKDAGSSPQVRVVRRLTENGQAVRVKKKQRSSNSTRKREENPLVEGRSHWRF
ncbi:hypothetical protein TNIN_454401 [Trichonephila inaurata madagascariensis]|uniref:Uncharacterized protein n=1 Tax=Trichonephila inaurata madagascariensis TaxID=2747483 RepID=A0A8X7C201_9ARAC|nr:hypothetical protein TNIN_454401 [Trichonephila inaurata madagascariensis]